jgi:hypothetical protein
VFSYDRVYGLADSGDTISAASVLLDEFERLVSIGEIHLAIQLIVNLDFERAGAHAVLGVMRSSKRLNSLQISNRIPDAEDYILRKTGLSIKI